MIRKITHGVFLLDGDEILPEQEGLRRGLDRTAAARGTMAYRIMHSHNVSGREDRLSLRFDALAAHDMTYVGVLQSAAACGIKEFSIPFIMTDCHNSLCIAGGTFNEDDHLFSLSAAKRFGGIHVPAHQVVIHQYMRETQAGGGKMILGADSHTRYGPLGTMAIGEGAGELVKQLAGRTYDLTCPQTVLVWLDGAPAAGVGPMDVALVLIKAGFCGGFVKNCILEFCGPGIRSMAVDFRNGVDVMMTETSCLSTIWETDEQVRDFLAIHGRAEDHRDLHPEKTAYYDKALVLDLSRVVPMIAMPFHPSNAYTITEFQQNASDILALVEEDCFRQTKEFGLRLDLRGKLHDGQLRVDQGVIAGCAGGLYTNLCAAADILRGHSIGKDAFGLHIYPASQPIFAELIRNGAAGEIIGSGADLRSAFCGPCFGAGDIPGQMGLSVRHTTRNFAHRDGSRPRQGQLAAVALMDARSIAATAIHGGVLTSAADLDGVVHRRRAYHFDSRIYSERCLDLFGKPNAEEPLVMGANIRPIPPLPVFRRHLLLRVASYLPDAVTTTDELIPNGESASYRSNLLRLADYALSTRDPAYVPRAKAVRDAVERFDCADAFPALPELDEALRQLEAEGWAGDRGDITLGSVLVSQKPGDGSAREYAAICQRMLGGAANICREYATKRYRSNLINWGIFPFTCEDTAPFPVDAFVFIPNLREALLREEDCVTAYILGGAVRTARLSIAPLLPEEREILLKGCLINYYRKDD